MLNSDTDSIGLAEPVRCLRRLAKLRTRAIDPGRAWALGILSSAACSTVIVPIDSPATHPIADMSSPTRMRGLLKSSPSFSDAAGPAPHFTSRTMSVPVTIIIHSLNEEVNIPFALDDVVGWADQVCVMDSDSTDQTQQLARARGAEVYSRPCTREGLVEQRNWALENIPLRNEWVFILDADEQLDPLLKAEIEHLVRNDDGTKDGYWCRFKLIFMSQWIRRSSMYPSWSMRLFRHALVRYERRDVNSHPLVKPGREGYLQEHILNNDRRGFSNYLKRLDEFSTLEARAYDKRQRAVAQESLLRGELFGMPAQRRRYLKNLFIRLPFRPLVIFVYLYFIRLGLLDGRPGFDYAFFKAVCEWAITVKHIEMKAG